MEYHTEIFDWESFFLPYEQALNELRLKFNTFKAQYERRGEYSPIYYVTARLKSINSILDKAKKYDFSIEEIGFRINDIVGIRLVTKFEEDVFALTKLLELRTDMRVVLKKDYFTVPKPSGYKSMHIIIEYDVNTVNGLQTVLCEIQIRTLAMDFWASIEHSLRYKYKDEMPPDVQKRLVNAARVVMDLDNEMGQIRGEITQAQQLYGKKTDVINQITAGLNLLSKAGESRLADQYYNDFSKIKDEDNTLQLVLLEKELEKDLRDLKIEARLSNSGEWASRML
ncbi:MAG: GTP pyrophosphokinase family protein [Eubacteriaceae bacterium]|jgi:putative GTP pyrophosphokinase|nr:GTP pyrophosphokinase family protein [Eubacteriaceae bacterium]